MADEKDNQKDNQKDSKEELKAPPISFVTPGLDVKFPEDANKKDYESARVAAQAAAAHTTGNIAEAQKFPTPLMHASAEPAASIKTAHDPTGAILEKNVKLNEVIEKVKQAEETAADLFHRKVDQLKSILKNKGMDSQQAEQALAEILNIIKE